MGTLLEVGTSMEEETAIPQKIAISKKMIRVMLICNEEFVRTTSD